MIIEKTGLVFVLLWVIYLTWRIFELIEENKKLKKKLKELKK